MSTEGLASCEVFAFVPMIQISVL